MPSAALVRIRCILASSSPDYGDSARRCPVNGGRQRGGRPRPPTGFDKSAKVRDWGSGAKSEHHGSHPLAKPSYFEPYLVHLYFEKLQLPYFSVQRSRDSANHRLQIVMATNQQSPESNEARTLPRADNVCLSCRRKKKKCDKSLPGCLQCKRYVIGELSACTSFWVVGLVDTAQAHKSRLHLQCIYEGAESVPVMEEFRQLRKRLKLFEEMLIPGTSKVSNPTTRLVVDLSAPGTAVERGVTGHEADLLSRLEALASKLNVGEEVHQLLQSHPGEIYGVSQIYFDNIHRWLPIMSQKLFYRRLTEFSKTQRPDFALLLLSIVLSIHCPASGTTQEPLYRAVRSTFWSLNATVDASLEMVQSGVILSCYEYGFGMYKECYKTIGVCVRMGQLMGLQDEKPPSDELQYSDEWIRRAERCNLWWALVIRDRFGHSHHASVGG